MLGLVPTRLLAEATVDLALAPIRDLEVVLQGESVDRPDLHLLTRGRDPGRGPHLVPILHEDVGGLVPDLDPHSCLQFVLQSAVHLLFNRHLCMCVLPTAFT